jgi:hypothetical protein
MSVLTHLFSQQSFPSDIPFMQDDSFSRKQPVQHRDMRPSNQLRPLNSLHEMPVYSGADALTSRFVIVNRRATRKFIQSQNLSDVLLQSEKHIDAAFGQSSVKTLTIVEDDEGHQTLFCLVAFPATLAEGQAALRSFDRNWWLNCARRFGSKLNFDFELV